MTNKGGGVDYRLQKVPLPSAQQVCRPGMLIDNQIMDPCDNEIEAVSGGEWVMRTGTYNQGGTPFSWKGSNNQIIPGVVMVSHAGLHMEDGSYKAFTNIFAGGGISAFLTYSI